MDFEEDYSLFLSKHVGTGDAWTAARMQDGLGHSEVSFLRKVWWPAFHNFEWLHPEYPTLDYGNQQRFIDFAYLRGRLQVAIEIDGMGPHLKDIKQEQFLEHINRHNQLVIDGWTVIRFTTMQIETRPRECQRIVQQLIGRLTNETTYSLREFDLVGRAIVQLVLQAAVAVTISDIVERLDISRSTALRRIRELVNAGWLEFAGQKARSSAYRLPEARRHTL